MGSKDDHLFPSLPIHGEEGETKALRGAFTFHLQNTRLSETIGKSSSGFPGKCAEKCEHMLNMKKRVQGHICIKP